MKKLLLVLLTSALWLPASVNAAVARLQVDTKTHALTDELGGTVIDAKSVTLTVGGMTIYDGAGVKTVVTGSTSGAMFGATGNKIGFLGATPVVRQTGNVFSALAAFGLVTSPSLTIANVTSLQSSLDAKANDIAVVHTSAFNGLGDSRYPQLSGSYANPSWIASIPFSKLSATPTSIGGYGIVLPASDVPALDWSKITTGKPTTIGGYGITDPIALLSTPQTFTAAQSFYSVASNSVVSTVLATPAAPIITHSGTAGASTWTYAIVAKLSDGSYTAAGPTGSTTTGNATLDNSNYNNLSWTAVTGAASYDIYRTTVGLSPSTTGKIANVSVSSYSDKGASGNAATPPATNTTGRVAGAIHDSGGAFYDITAPPFNGSGDGVTDNLAAFNAVQAAIDAAGGMGTILFPPGTYLFSGDAVIGSGKSVVSSGGRYGTTLMFSSGGLVLGSSIHTFNGTIRGLTIEHIGSFGSLPSGSTGITTAYYQYATIEDVFVSTYDIGIKAGGNGSNHLTIRASTIFNIQSRSIWLLDAIQTTLSFVDCGKGGFQNSPSVGLVVIGGTTDTVRGSHIALYGDDLVTPTCAAIMFENYTPGNGGFYFHDIDTEKVACVVRSDSSSSSVNQLRITNSRLLSDAKFFDSYSGTTWVSLNISDNEQIAFYQNTTIPNLFRSRFMANTITRTSSASSLTFSSVDGQLNFLGNTSECDIILTGSWKGLNSTSNNFRFNGGLEVGYTLTATGIFSSIGNRKDAGTQPSNIVSNGTITSVIPTVLTTTAVIDFPSTPSLGNADATVTLTGVAAGDDLIVSPAATTAGIVTPVRTGVDTVTLTFFNIGGATRDPPSLTYTVTAIRH